MLIVFSEDTEITVEIEFGIYNGTVYELKGTRRVYPGAIRPDFGLSETDIPCRVGNVVNHCVAYDVVVPIGQRFHIVRREA